MALFRFRRFRTRLLLLVAGLVAAVLAAVYLLVTRANEANAREHIRANLQVGENVFNVTIQQGVDNLTNSAKVMTGDYAIRTVLLQEDTATRRSTLVSMLRSYAERTGSPLIALFDAEGELLANSDGSTSNENTGPFAHLIEKAAERDMESGSGYSYLNGGLHVLVVVPLYAPYPEVAAWFGLAFPIDSAFALSLKRTTQLEITFATGQGPEGCRVLASTLHEPAAAAAALWGGTGAGDMAGEVMVVGENYLSRRLHRDLLGEDPIAIVLQRSLDAELAPARELEQFILIVALAGFAAAILAAAALARNVSRPVQRLAAHTRTVAAGDYSQRLDLRRDDELGELAASFNQMTAGLAERDRVRDLLGKVVSPEIASQLLGSQLKLGGEEREVTILFSDIRDFTTLSERMPPAELLALLNRYLDRMSAIVEKHGGVIDKFIGDAIMALYGAPVATPGAADRALATAREMDAALAELNRELAAEGRPALAIGIGINTGPVIAGNMGSKTRLNYTVIGDGVNLAARLEGLTKDPAYNTRIIISEATLRAAKHRPPVRELGEVTVKGKQQAVRIYAVSAKGESVPPFGTGS
jgi:adenylate cyclase